MIKVYSVYQNSTKRGGGANNFLTALKTASKSKEEIEFVENIESADIIFLNGGGKGPLKESKRVGLFEYLRLKNRGKPILIRAINLKLHSYNHNIIHAIMDFLLIKKMNLADFVIFQSQYQKNTFLGAGFKNTNSRVIHNGSLPIKFHIRITPQNKIKLLSISTARKQKNHDLISKLSKLDYLEITHVGTWNEKIPKRNVNYLGFKNKDELENVMSEHHALIHLAVQDQCPNVIFEAIQSGLPVIYYDKDGSSKEIVQDCGISIDLTNPEVTFNEFKKNYTQYIDNIIKKRDYYSILRAIEEYEEVINSLVKIPKVQF